MWTRQLRTLAAVAAGVVVAYLIVEVALQLAGVLGSSGTTAVAASGSSQNPVSVPFWLQSPPPFKPLPFAPPTGSASQPPAPASKTQPAPAPANGPGAQPGPPGHHKPHG